jgi:hypothetical protein
MSKHLDSDNLIPFRRHDHAYHLPQLAEETAQETVDEVDPGLEPEDQGFIRHYLGYADVLLRAADQESRQSKVIEMPAKPSNKKKTA